MLEALVDSYACTFQKDLHICENYLTCMTVLRPYGVRLTIQLFYCMLAAFLFCILSKLSTPLKIISRNFTKECDKWTKLVTNKNDHSFLLISYIYFSQNSLCIIRNYANKVTRRFVISKQMALSGFNYFFDRYLCYGYISDSTLWNFTDRNRKREQLSVTNKPKCCFHLLSFGTPLINCFDWKCPH